MWGPTSQVCPLTTLPQLGCSVFGSRGHVHNLINRPRASEAGVKSVYIML